MTQTIAPDDSTFEARLVNLLSSAVADHRRAAAVVLGAMAVGTEATVGGLQRALSDPDPAVRTAAVVALGELAPKSLVRHLRPVLKDDDPGVRLAVRRVLAEGPGVELEELGRMLEGRDEKQRVGAIAVLGARGGPEARRMLLTLLPGGSQKVQEALQEALAPEVAKLAGDEVIGFLHELDAVLAEADGDAIARAASSVVKLLGAVEHGAVTGVLARMVESSAPTEVRVRAVDALRRAAHGHRGAQEHAFKVLVGLLEHGAAPELLSVAADALDGMDLPIALEPRVRALTKSEATPVRRWAIRSLGQLDSSPAARALAQVVVEGDPTDRALALEAASSTVQGRRALAKALAQITDADRARAVVSVLESHVGDLTKAILEALEDSVVSASPEVAEAIVRLLRERGGPGNLIEKAEERKAGGAWADAADLLRRIAGDAVPEATFLLGVCELKLSKKNLSRGSSHDPAVAHFRALTKNPKFATAERLEKDPDLEPEELYYLGFSLAEDKSDAVRGLGADILSGLAERHEGAPLGKRATQKLRTMGWID